MIPLWPKRQKAAPALTASPAQQQRLHDQLATLKLESLQQLMMLLRRQFQLTPIMAVEVEFYLLGDLSRSYPAALLATIDNTLRDAGIHAHPAEQERGTGQYEVALHPTENLPQLAVDVQMLPSLLKSALVNEGFDITFAPKPYADDFGSGTHWHIHLESERMARNVFTRSEEGRYSREMLWSVAGLLETLPEAMLCFAAKPEAYARFVQPKLNAPTHIGWGPNNRTAALRLPNKDLKHKHIEHRVAGADADPWMSILAILAGVAYGLEAQDFPIDAVYGDASDTQYALEPLPNFTTAVDLFKQSTALPRLMGEELCGEYLSRVVYPDAY